MRKRIYLDTGAGMSNPSSIHLEGVIANQKLEQARLVVAQFLGAHSDEIIFTSSGTEANNLAIFGLAGRILTTNIEHPSILNASLKQESNKIITDYVSVGENGLVSPKKIFEALRPDTKLVSIHLGNSEIGVIQPVKEIAKMIRKFRKVNSVNPSWPYFHIDACQASRFLDLNVTKLGVDLLTFNGSKTCLPAGKVFAGAGTGVLYLKRGIKLNPILVGGGQESGRRAGTENLDAILKFVDALKICQKNRESESVRLIRLRDYFIDKVLKNIPETILNGDLVNRLPHNINISFLGADSEYVVLSLDALGVACSTGSACGVRMKSESYVVRALTGDINRAQSAVRFTLGRETKKSDLDYVLKILPKIIKRARTGLQLSK